MTKGNQKLLCEENLRHAEYYSMLSVFDDLYEKSKSGVVFEDLMPLILKRENICCYTAEGRKLIHDNLRVNMYLLLSLMTQPLQGRSVEYFDNRISHFSAQWGKCAVTGREFMSTAEIHCHHIIPKRNGGTDKYDNLILITPDVHILLHAKTHETIEKYKAMLRLNSKQLSALNSLRQKAGLATI